MLFNSHVFIFVFLPITLTGFFVLSNGENRRAARLWLVILSLIFYAWWDPIYVLLLGGMTGFTYVMGRAIGSARLSDPARSKWLLRASVLTLLGILGYYKYITFFTEWLSAMTGLELVVRGVVLPLAISFFTFQMIAYVNDCWKDGDPDYSFDDFCLFIMFFPQLIAGPIVHHSEIVPQLKSKQLGTFDENMFCEGLAFFVMGLIKKLAFADPLSSLAAPMFAADGSVTDPGLFLGWMAMCAYGLGLYFDFSGYSDMAVGLARMFGIKLPYNFNSPYKSFSIIDFWRRWHITLSTFLRDYLYIPLGGNRKGSTRRSINLMITMLLGGLWHGAGWTFVIWGGLHGTYLLINHAWNQAVSSGKSWARQLGPQLSQALTLIAVMIAWIFFASPTFAVAWNVMEGVIGLNGIGAISVHSDGPYNMEILSWGILLLGFAIVLFMPNSQEIIDGDASKAIFNRFAFIRFTPTTAAGAVAGCGLVLSLTLMADVKEFVYFQF